MEQSYNGFLNLSLFFFYEHMCSQHYGLVRTSVFSIYIRNPYRGFRFNKECQQLEFRESYSYNKVFWDLRKLLLDVFYKCFLAYTGKCTTKFKFQLRNISIQSPPTDRPLFSKKYFGFFKKNLFKQFLIFETINDKNCDTRHPSPLIQL